jgi:hypothetical protein
MKVNVEIFVVTDSAPLPEGSKVEFPVSMWFNRVPIAGEIIEFADVATGDYQDLTLEVAKVIWTVDERKPDAPEAEPQFGEARAQVGCRVVAT